MQLFQQDSASCLSCYILSVYSLHKSTIITPKPQVTTVPASASLPYLWLSSRVDGKRVMRLQKSWGAQVPFSSGLVAANSLLLGCENAQQHRCQKTSHPLWKERVGIKKGTKTDHIFCRAKPLQHSFDAATLSDGHPQRAGELELLMLQGVYALPGRFLLWQGVWSG